MVPRYTEKGKGNKDGALFEATQALKCAKWKEGMREAQVVAFSLVTL